MKSQKYKCRVRQRSRLGMGNDELPRNIGYWYSTDFILPGLSRKQTIDIVTAAFILANQYVPIPFYRARNRNYALIEILLGTTGQFDGLGGTLAEAEVVSLYEPYQRRIWFDPLEDWKLNRAETYQTYALPVLCHEIGHTLGFGHGKTGLMAPYYDPLITTPTKQEVKKLYSAYPEFNGIS